MNEWMNEWWRTITISIPLIVVPTFYTLKTVCLPPDKLLSRENSRVGRKISKLHPAWALVWPFWQISLTYSLSNGILAQQVLEYVLLEVKAIGYNFTHLPRIVHSRVFPYDKFTCLQFWASHTCTHILTHTHTYTQQATKMPHLINTSVEKCKTNFMSSSKFIDILKCEQTIRSMDAAIYGQFFIPVINFVVWIDLCIRFTIHYTIESAQFIS